MALKLGFVFDRRRGSHAVYYRSSDHARIVVPMHAGRTIKPKTLTGILDDMGLTTEEFRDLLKATAPLVPRPFLTLTTGWPGMIHKSGNWGKEETRR